jgi:magnesium-transporting ATPase (P-type)
VIWSALGRLAERGVIVRSGDAIERLATVNRVMFDKTGTLTEDRFTLLDIETTSTGEERTKLLGWLALVQSQSNHPVAKPFAELPRPFAPGAEPRVTSLKTVPGCGVVAELVEANGERHGIRIGTSEWIGLENLPPLTLPFSKGRGSKTIHVSLDGELAAVATVAERLRASTPEAIAHFAQLGLTVEVLTGDSLDRAKALNLPATRGGLSPDDKRSIVEAAKTAGGKPLFIGDGINDASALATAHLGVALASGTDLAVSAAPVTLHGNDLRAIPWAVELSRDAVRAVRWNLCRALCYNVVGMTLAACGVLHPVVAAVLMVVSSITLIFSSTRIGNHRERCESFAKEKPTPPVSQPSSFRPSLLTPHSSFLAVSHALCFALQGVVFLLLLASVRELPSAAFLLGAFALVGGVLAYCWHRWSTIPHWVDMCFGMFTFGNLGMLLGWWADNGFSALPAGGCCKCVEAMRAGVMQPWMWVGMLVFANVAMRWFTRRSMRWGSHAVAMFTGGNAGMVLGMILGGSCATQFATTSMTGAVAGSFAGMTVGMLAGMLFGTWLAEQVCGLLRVARKQASWFTRTGSRTA